MRARSHALRVRTRPGRYVDDMSKFSFRGKKRKDGKITLAEFEEYFEYLAEADTNDAETSPAACRVRTNTTTTNNTPTTKTLVASSL